MDFNIAIDSVGIIHLAYVRILSTEASPSGIYYRASKDNGVNWNTSRALYQSQYFRSLTPEDANVNISVSGDGSIYVVWDIRPLKRILFTKIMDGDTSLTEPIVLQGPEIENGNNIPFDVNIIINGNEN
jgi:hypothetical protein